MTFLAASRLVLAVLVLVVAIAYVVLQLLGRRRYAVRFTNLDLLASVAPKRPGWRRFVPASLLLASMSAMVLALARPARQEEVPRERATIVLAIDVSISMQADDVEPSRFDAAKDAASSFVALLPAPINLGLVAFAGTASVVVAPTTDRAQVRAAIDRLELEEATAIGEAVFSSLAAIEAVPAPTDANEVPGHVVVMSDGETTAGRPNELAAEAAREADVPVTTIGFGTDAGTITYQSELVPVPVNEAELAALAEATGGSSFEAVTGDELRSVYEDIGSAIGYDIEEREITTWFVGAAFALALLTAAASLAWFSRLP